VGDGDRAWEVVDDVDDVSALAVVLRLMSMEISPMPFPK
jgi:hypothetical protein